MKHFYLFLLLALLCACQPNAEMVSLGVEETYAIYRMKTLHLHPEFVGSDGYRWTTPASDGRDSLLATARDFYFVGPEPGEYHLKLEILDKQNPLVQEITIKVWEEDVVYSKYISKVLEYRPAPGQFVNLLPKYEEGDTEADMIRKCEESISDRNDVMVSLGNYGGYITFAFDHTVVNIPGEYDFKIFGNAFYAAANPNPDSPSDGGSAEPGIVMVSIDANGNGLPDDEWYELAGSEHFKPKTKWGYQLTYYRPDSGHKPTPIPDTPITDSSYIPYSDNYGESGFVEKNSYHTQSYWPAWIAEDRLAFSGTCLPKNAVDESGTGTYFVLYAYDWGYADNHPNEIADKSNFKIDWAVDAQGNHVNLPGADFIRVYTGVNQQCGWLGETSTEICRAEDLHL